MATVSATIISKVRNLLSDISTSGKDLFTYESSAIFTLSESNVIAVSIVYKNSVEIDDSDWSFDADTNKVTITASLTAGDTIEIDYTYYPNYSNTELKAYMQSALYHISVNNYQDFRYDATEDEIYPELTLREENLLAMITAIVIDKPIQSYRLPDITINFPPEINTQDKIRKTIATFKKDSHGIIDLL